MDIVYEYQELYNTTHESATPEEHMQYVSQWRTVTSTQRKPGDLTSYC